MRKKDIVILSNGPGEITTWVYPVVRELKRICSDSMRISVILSPCPNSMGNEAEIVAGYDGVDRVQGAQDFLPFLLLGKTGDNWSWYKEGIVLFLGGDQFFALVISKRLGYRSLIYAEWEARWYRFIDHFAVMNNSVINNISPKYHSKFTVVGDLMSDVSVTNNIGKVGETIIGLLPGSKRAKLMLGVPLMLAIASFLQQTKPEVKFIIPVAPTINTDILARYANPQDNPLVNIWGKVKTKLIKENQREYLVTSDGLKIELITKFPCYEILTNCSLCLTTVGANTAQLGSLLIPMIVLLPTQQLDAMRSWDGIPGILANLPLFGGYFAKLINWLVLRQKRLFAWPNIWAKTEIVPELVGELKAAEVGQMILDLLDHPEKLASMKNKLAQVRGESGAATKIVEIIATMV
jgi:lipid-A-disaccharide synthase